MACPPAPYPAYGNYPQGTLFSAAYTPPNVSPPGLPSKAYPSYPTPTQGECLPDCPFIAALQSIAWVNRNFIINNIPGPGSGPGSYTVYFWDYPQASYPPPVALPAPGSPCQLNSVAAVGNPVKTQVVVSQNIPLDSSSSPIDPSNTMYYGAGSSNKGEIWPSLYEKAYAKFCLYKNQTPIKANNGNPLQAGDLTDTTKDPLFSDVQLLTKPQWGGNAGIGLMYLTGLPCWTYNLANAASFTAAGGLSCGSQGNIYSYIKTGFCQTTTGVYGPWKTRYPLVAWTYPSESQSPAGPYNGTTGIKYDPSGIMADHCYPILGVYEPTINGQTAHYIILGTTFGCMNPSPNIPVPNYINLAPPAATFWSCYDALFRIGSVAAYPSSAAIRPNNISINLSNGIFGIEGMTTFQNYFAAIGWAQGY
jgi:hypothetical protein